MMNTEEKVLQILTGIKPNKDMTQVEDIIEGGYLDSFELMALIAQLSDEFGIEIGFDEITPENFNTVKAIVAMTDRLLGKK